MDMTALEGKSPEPDSSPTAIKGTDAVSRTPCSTLRGHRVELTRRMHPGQKRQHGQSDACSHYALLLRS